MDRFKKKDRHHSMPVKPQYFNYPINRD